MAPVNKFHRPDESALSINDAGVEVGEQNAISFGMMKNDDHFPGSFFRIPGVPSPGKTTWRLTE